jgi:hypothetical protein
VPALARLIDAVLTADSDGAGIAAGIDVWNAELAGAGGAVRVAGLELLRAVWAKVQFNLQDRVSGVMKAVEERQ